MHDAIAGQVIDRPPPTARGAGRFRRASRAAARYGAAVLGALAAWRATLIVWPWVAPNVGPIFFLVMVATAWFAGLGPALVSTAIAGVCMAWYVPNPLDPIGFGAGDTVRLGTFVLTAVMITWLNASRKQAQAALAESWRLHHHVEEQRQRLEVTNDRLRQEVVERQRAQEETLSHQETLRKLAAELSLAEERERREIASQLHDGVGQMLAFTQMRLESGRGAVQEPRARAAIDEALAQLKEAIGQTRSLTRELSPPVLYESGLTSALEWLADNVRRRHALPVFIDRHGAGRDQDVSREIRVFLFQAVRELLTNIVKHAGASEAHVTLYVHGPSLRVVVEDDGRGFPDNALDPAACRDGGFGLLNIRERATHLGGHFDIENDPGHGARVMLTVPTGYRDTTAPEAKPTHVP